VFERNERVDNDTAEALGRRSRTICFDCALAEITGGRAPEEGDFNSARLVSGEISDQDLQYLDEDLRAVEEGRSISEPSDDDTDPDWQDPAWCYTCNRDTAFCMCVCPKCGENNEDCRCP